VTCGVVPDGRFKHAPSGAGCPFHQYDARLAASRILAGPVGARLPDREDFELHQMVLPPA
jgi:hypothetical protein